MRIYCLLTNLSLPFRCITSHSNKLVIKARARHFSLYASLVISSGLETLYVTLYRHQVVTEQVFLLLSASPCCCRHTHARVTQLLALHKHVGASGDALQNLKRCWIFKNPQNASNNIDCHSARNLRNFRSTAVYRPYTSTYETKSDHCSGQAVWRQLPYPRNLIFSP